MPMALVLSHDVWRTTKATLLSDSSSQDDIESAAKLLLTEANSYSVSFYENIISPILRHLFKPSKCPIPNAPRLFWESRLNIFDILCNYIHRGPRGTTTFKTTINAILPGLILWALFILDCELEEAVVNNSVFHFFKALNAVITVVPMHVLINDHPQFGASFVTGYYLHINHHVSPSFVNEGPYILWNDINKAVYARAPSHPMLKRQLAATAPKTATAFIAILAKIISSSPTPFSFIVHGLPNMEELGGVDVIAYALFKHRVVYWCIHVLWLAIQTDRSDGSASRDIIIDAACATLSLLHLVVTSLGRDAIEQAASLRLFDVLAKLEPLASRSKLIAPVRNIIRALTPFTIYTNALLPAVRSLRLTSFQWAEEEDTFTHFVLETYKARRQYGSMGRHICWSYHCPYFDYGGPECQETPHCCLECSQCARAAYCSLECQQEAWDEHRTTCQRDRISRDNHFVQDDDGNITVNAIQLRPKEMGFFFFRATNALQANINLILSHFVTADFSAYRNVGGCIVVDSRVPNAIIFQPASNIPVEPPVPGDIPLDVLAPSSFLNRMALKSIIYPGMLELPGLEQMRERIELGTSQPTIVQVRSRMSENPVGGWRLEV